jgi:hypothetical protein
MTRPATRSETGVGKAPRHEIAGIGAPSVPRGLYGDLAAASGWARLDRIARGHRIASRGGVDDGRSGRCRSRLPVQLRADLAPRSKRRLCWLRARRNGERHWVGRSLVTASRGVDADRWGCGGGAVFGLAFGREGLDDDHPAAAALAGARQHVGFVGGCGLGRLGRVSSETARRATRAARAI